MTNLRLWIVLLAASAFGAGLGVGWFASSQAQVQAERARASGPFEGFRREFVAVFGLSPERERLLRELLSHYEREIDDLERAQLESSRGELTGKLENLAVTYGGRIRNSVLPPDQRAEYDRLAAGMDWKASN